MLPVDLNGVAVLRMAPHKYKVAHNIFWRSCANLFCFFFSYFAFHLAPQAGNSDLSLTHYLICFVLLSRCFGVASLLRRSFGVASALLQRCLRVASALLRRLFGVPWASALLRRRALQLRCNFGATSAQPWLNNAFGSTKTSWPAAQMLICVIFGLPVVCTTGSS